MLQQGDSVPDLPFVQPGGSKTSLSTLLERGTPVLLSFFKSSCPVCQYTLPFLNRLNGDGLLQVIGVSQDNEETTGAFGSAFGVDFPLLMDPSAGGYVASNAFKISNVPSLFLVGPDRRIELASTGFSRRDLEAIGARFGLPVFQAGEDVPDFRPG